MANNKNLPIRIFEKRENVDDRLTEGGGGKQPPKWVLNDEELLKKSTLLLDDLMDTYPKVEGKLNKYKGTPAVIKAKVNDDAIAKSHRKELKDLFLSSKQDNRVIGISNEQELYIRVDNIEQLRAVDRNLKQVKRNEKAISGIDKIDTYDPIISLDNINPQKDGKYILKIRFFDFNNYQLNDMVLRNFKELIKNNPHIELMKTVKYTDSLYIHQVKTDSLDSINLINDFSPLMSIEPMPMLEVVEDDFFSEATLDMPEPEEGRDYPIVGVLDSGIADIQSLRSWKLSRYTNYPEELLNPAHGTFVAGIINFGDILEGKDYTGTKGFKLLDAAVFPNANLESITEAELIDNIREVVEEYGKHIKIWNLSLGSKTDIKNAEFSEFGTALDNIQDENNILIIKSVGNCKNFLDGRPVSRIARGADSVRALTVGSIAQSKNDSDASELNHLSPFSRIGPGPSNIIKPELVHYGGNCGVDNNRPIPNGVTSFDVNGNISKNIGTSFSTPRVTAIAADLHNRIGEDFDPVLIKALMIHSAKYPLEVDLPNNEKVNQLGFGIPGKAEDILYNDPYEITLVLRDTLSKGEFIEILDLPYPPSMINGDGYFYGQIFLTLVNTPTLAVNQGPEYCQSNIEVALGTYDEKTSRDTSVATIRNPIGRIGGQNLLTSSIFSKRKISETENFARSEKVLLQYGDKFYPNKKYAVDLSELTQGKKEKFLLSPKKWYLKVEGLYREYIETQAEQERMGLSQDFCILITFKDPLREKHVYDEISQLLDSNNFIHRSIKIRQDIDIQVD
ncbi:S8 family peptidase [Neobacillus sp.]|uniref:S8 family peptidase n=1 Tax=Neobacillus sp. TaxID=2675273 RepID=UPI00289D0CC3|nr:S8 family peptidase [Neobacillus sp.]